MVKCKGVGWFHNPRNKIPEDHVKLFELSEKDLRSNESARVVEEELKRFCVVEGLELSPVTSDAFIDSLVKLPHLTLIKQHLPSTPQPAIDQLARLPHLDTLITNIVNTSTKEDYSKLRSLKTLVVNGLTVIKDAKRLPQGIETLILNRGMNRDPDEKLLQTIKGLQNLKRVHLINSSIEDQFVNEFRFEVNHDYFRENSGEKKVWTPFPERVFTDLCNTSLDLATSLPDRLEWRDERLYPEDDMAL